MKENQLKKSLSIAKGNHRYGWLDASRLPSSVQGSGSAKEIKNQFRK